MEKNYFRIFAGLICVLFPATSFAQTAPTRVEDKSSFVNVKYQIWGSSRDQESFDENDPLESREDVYHRLNIDAGIKFGSLRLHLNTDLIPGQLVGPDPAKTALAFNTNNANDEQRGKVFDELIPNIIDPYNAYVEYQSIFLARLGLQSSDFGMGLVANSGKQKPYELFNQSIGGDRALRLMLGFRPFALGPKATRVMKKISVVVGGDYVFVDDNASLIRGDQAIQGIASVFYQDQNPVNPDEKVFLGAYFAHRNQTDDNGEKLVVSAFDLSGRKAWLTKSKNWSIDLGFESALISGSTDRAYTQSGNAETNVLAFGTAVEMVGRHLPLQLGAKLKAGYASGDANTDDDTLFRFRFDPNYKAGLILYDHYLPAMTRQSYFRATDPTQSGEPPRGVHNLISDGAIENTIFLNPQLLFGNSEGLLAGVGMLWAKSAVPLADPFSSFKNGGTPIGINGGEGSRDLGIEVDAAVQYKVKLVADLSLEAKIEYGILFPGKAFDDAQGNAAPAQNLVRGRLGLSW